MASQQGAVPRTPDYEYPFSVHHRFYTAVETGQQERLREGEAIASTLTLPLIIKHQVNVAILPQEKIKMCQSKGRKNGDMGGGK